MFTAKMVFLGTNGWYTTETGNTTCVFMETKDSYIVLDAGNGIYRLDEYVKKADKPIYVFLSHFHVDHISGLHILAKFKFPQGLTICGHKGARDILDRIMRQPYTVPFRDLPFKTEVRELEEGISSGFPFRLEAREVPHSSTCFAYRFEIGSKVITYCTDAGYCPAAVELARGADVLITECSLRPGEKNEKWPHLNPADAAGLAREAKAGKLVLIHFDADNYRTAGDRERAQAEAGKVFNNVTAARDGMVLEI
jgi:ribonuclease BN (tRNA processing enzyme)